VPQAASLAGAQVTLVAGPVSLVTPFGVKRINVRSALDMHAAVMAALSRADVFIATAAVADWRPEQAATQKIKKDGSGQMPAMQWTENPDILAEAAATERARNGDLFCVGFAAESHDLLAHAQAKLARKKVPLIVGNIGADTFGADDNALSLVDTNGTAEWSRAPKTELAQRLVAEIAKRIQRS
jgi:phosphopantothenoylcysteine decarboxylase/phosphopantothenate--cysteine ligase